MAARVAAEEEAARSIHTLCWVRVRVRVTLSVRLRLGWGVAASVFRLRDELSRRLMEGGVSDNHTRQVIEKTLSLA